MKTWFVFCLVGIVVSLIVIWGYGPVPETVVIEEAKNVQVTRLASWMNRVIDEEVGVVCYSGHNWGYCFLLSETELDY